MVQPEFAPSNGFVREDPVKKVQLHRAAALKTAEAPQQPTVERPKAELTPEEKERQERRKEANKNLARHLLRDEPLSYEASTYTVIEGASFAARAARRVMRYADEQGLVDVFGPETGATMRWNGLYKHAAEIHAAGLVPNTDQTEPTPEHPMIVEAQPSKLPDEAPTHPHIR